MPSVPEGHVDVIYLCYPNNPTGTTLTKEQLKPFVDYAREHGAVIVYDAAYKAFITSGVPHSIYEVEGAKEVAVECCSFSKTAGFTGVRCAYSIVPHAVKGKGGKGRTCPLNALWKRRMGTKFNGVSYPVQRAAAAVFTPRGLGAVPGNRRVLPAQRAAHPRRAGRIGLPGVRRRGRALCVAENPTGQLGVFRRAA